MVGSEESNGEAVNQQGVDVVYGNAIMKSERYEQVGEFALALIPSLAFDSRQCHCEIRDT